MADYNIKIENTVFDNNSCVIRYDYAAGHDDTTKAILQELQKIQGDIAQSEPMIASSLRDLQKAVQERDEPRVSKIAKQLSTGIAAPFLANLASGTLLSFLGIR